MAKYIMALDAGTTSERCILFDRRGRVRSMAQRELAQHFPEPGWVEQDANEIWQTQLSVAREAMARVAAEPSDVVAIGIANQRETSVVWDRETGQPVCRAIVWQCRRTADLIEELKARDPTLAETFRKKTGLVMDPYFSGTKIRWILDNVEGARERAEAGELCFGTVDSWLIYKLTKGHTHVTDYSNASRTLLFDINALAWDEGLCSALGVPMGLLPRAMPSNCVYGEADPEFLGASIPIAGAAGDQQAALFGQTCFGVGEAKGTYGTGCFMLMNTGHEPVFSRNGLLTTVAWGLDGTVAYALEGSVYVAGAAIQWLCDELRAIDSSPDSEYFATRVGDTNGCYVVPAFTGLGAPYWDPYARGAIVGLTRGTNKYHVIRATLESIAFQVCDVLGTMEQDLGRGLTSLRVDGGACRNDFLMQFQSDVSDVPVRRPACVETTALGAAYLAGLAVGFWRSKADVADSWEVDREFVPAMPAGWRRRELGLWHRAVALTRGWAREEDGQ